MATSEATTRNVRVEVASRLLPERSNPSERQWFFVYTVTITNEGSETVQLLSRHWVISDANGAVQEVRGPGVVGQQPILAPGEAFQYSSACPLTTPFGTMHGSYQMVNDGGDNFDAEIPAFALGQPETIH